MVVKLQLASLDRTGSTVGRLSALGTAGAIAGTFVTGFVLVAAWPTTPILVGVAIAVIATGVVVDVAQRSGGRRGRRHARIVGTACLAAIVGGAGAFAVNAALDPCERESAYYCARVDTAGLNCPDGLTLYLDTLRHSCVYPDDPTRLGYSYARRFADVLEAAAGPAWSPPDVLHVGGGGFTLPRYVSATIPRVEQHGARTGPGARRHRARRAGFRRIGGHPGDRRGRPDGDPDVARSVVRRGFR